MGTKKVSQYSKRVFAFKESFSKREGLPVSLLLVISFAGLLLM